MLTFQQLKQWAYRELDGHFVKFAHSPGAKNFHDLQDAMLVYQTLHHCELPADRMDPLLTKLASTYQAHWSEVVIREVLQCTLDQALGRPAGSEA